MEKMRDSPFAEQALNLIKTRGLLNEMSEFERMNAYSEWLEGLRAARYLSVAFSFAGVVFRIPVAQPGGVRVLQLPLSVSSLGPGHHQTIVPLALQSDFSQKRGVFLEPPTAPAANQAPCWERAISTAFPKVLTLRGGGGGHRENWEWVGAWSPSKCPSGKWEWKSLSVREAGGTDCCPCHRVNKRRGQWASPRSLGARRRAEERVQFCCTFAKGRF